MDVTYQCARSRSRNRGTTGTHECWRCLLSTQIVAAKKGRSMKLASFRKKSCVFYSLFLEADLPAHVELRFRLFRFLLCIVTVIDSASATSILKRILFHIR